MPIRDHSWPIFFLSLKRQPKFARIRPDLGGIRSEFVPMRHASLEIRGDAVLMRLESGWIPPARVEIHTEFGRAHFEFMEIQSAFG